MIPLLSIIILSLFHWFSDFILQTDYQATKKSTDNYALVSHVFSYTASMTLLLFICGGFVWNYHMYFTMQCLCFGSITFFAHLFTDYVTSRVNAQLWKEDKRHEFFVAIGFDQWLHLVQILFTFYYIF